MNETELEERKTRAANETLVIAPTEGGFRVYNPAAITNIYMVSGVPDSLKCNCPDFESHKIDPEWRCKHVLAFLNQEGQQPHENPPNESSSEPEPKESKMPSGKSVEKKRSRPERNSQHAQLLIKRSVSPDGRIDSLSVEFANPIDWSAEEEIKQLAKKALVLGAEIAKPSYKWCRHTEKPMHRESR